MMGLLPSILFVRLQAFSRKNMSVSILRSVTESPKKKKRTNKNNLLVTEGIFAVDKPKDWTTGDVVRSIRGILERDGRGRGAKIANIGSRRLCRIVQVGHGGTLDRLASGVLVIGVGEGTKNIATYLKGSKVYIAEGELGFETTTLDMEGKATRKGFFNHINAESIAKVIPEFTGSILQVPPISSAIQMERNRIHGDPRRGLVAPELILDPQEVEVLGIDLMEVSIPRFRIRVECRNGVSIHALIRDMGRRLDSASTTYSLVRTKHGLFTQDHCLVKEDWSADNIYEAIKNTKSILELCRKDDGHSDPKHTPAMEGVEATYSDFNTAFAEYPVST